MPRSRPGRRRLAALSAVLAVLAGTQMLFAPGASAAAFVPISGSGSTWSQNALDQWRRNVSNNYQITVNFAGTGSTAGRNDFKLGQVDFAVSEIPYGLREAGLLEETPSRPFGYMPIVAGGTALMYNLKIGGKRVTNLRLSGETITKIFTQQITTWSDPAIKEDNPGISLPARKIVPVVRSDGSGSSAQFTAWMADQYGGLWDDYCHRAGRNVTPCGLTSFFPTIGSAQAKPGSQGVAGYVAQDINEGTITYVEYSYARNAGFPVVKVLNKANYYVEPTAFSVAVALLQTQIHPDLTQDLSKVYVDTDPRSYPMSSYSYMIIPKDTSNGFSENKGATLSEFAYYFLCEGQQQADALGYSPLPVNLVQAGIDQVGQIPGSTHKLDRNDLSKCNNPTVSPDGGNKLAKTAPQPSPCDHKGASSQCAAGTGGDKTPTSTNGGGGPGGGGGSGGGKSGSGGPGGGGLGGGGTPTTTGGTNGQGPTAGDTPSGTLANGTTPSSTAIDPDTGQSIDATSLAGGSSTSGVTAVPVSVDVDDNRRQMVLGTLAFILLLGLVLAPPLVARTMRSRQGPQA